MHTEIKIEKEGWFPLFWGMSIFFTSFIKNPPCTVVFLLFVLH
jgi:hypothetical protein